MDLRVYYQKIREAESRIPDEFPIVVSNESADGGKQGVKTEVPRHIAAKLIVEGIAKLASDEEVAGLRAEMAEAKRTADRAAESSKLQLTILSSAELEDIRAGARKEKE